MTLFLGTSSDVLHGLNLNIFHSSIPQILARVELMTMVEQGVVIDYNLELIRVSGE